MLAKEQALHSERDLVLVPEQEQVLGPVPEQGLAQEQGLARGLR